MARALTPSFRAGKYLCLPPATGDLPTDGGVVVASAAGPFPKPIEHAGHAYQQRLRNVGCPDTAEKDATDTKPERAASAKKTGGVGDDEYALKRKLATDGDDLYELLELGEKRWHATADEIKKSFRRISLLYHPDKLRHRVSHLGDEAIAETENHFKKVMKAYDILSDKKKRASYDSIDDVDDSIPSEKELNDANFYKKMGECFALNARWSVSDRVPDLGDENTPMEKVNQFYDFWYSFKTWRDFSFDVEYNTDQAECREEKRWMDRQNAKHVKTRKVEESARVRRLVDLGYKKDPRIRKAKESAKAKKEAMKEARRKEKQDAEAAVRAEAEKSRLEEERRVLDEKEKRAQAKKEKDAMRKVLRKARQNLRTVGRELDLVSDVSAITAIEKMCTDGDVATIEAFADHLSKLAKENFAKSDASSGVCIPNVPELVDAVLAGGMGVVDGSSSAKESSDSADPSPTVVLQKSPEALSQGQSTVADAPKSPLPANGVKPANGSPKANGSHANGVKKDANPPWTEQEMSLLSKGVAKFPGGMKNRWERLAQYVGTRSEEEVLAKVNAMRTSNLKNGKSKKKSSEAKSEAAKPRVANGANGTHAPNGTSAADKPNGANGANGGGSGTIKGAPNKFVFTPKQQQQLEGALKKFPSSLGPGRWMKISAEVSGRSASECEERFKEIVTYLKAKKSAAK